MIAMANPGGNELGFEHPGFHTHTHLLGKTCLPSFHKLLNIPQQVLSHWREVTGKGVHSSFYPTLNEAFYRPIPWQLLPWFSYQRPN